MAIGTIEKVRATADGIAKGDQEVDQQRDRVGLGERFHDADDTAGKTVIDARVRRLRPGAFLQVRGSRRRPLPAVLIAGPLLGLGNQGEQVVLDERVEVGEAVTVEARGDGGRERLAGGRVGERDLLGVDMGAVHRHAHGADEPTRQPAGAGQRQAEGGTHQHTSVEAKASVPCDGASMWVRPS